MGYAWVKEYRAKHRAKGLCIRCLRKAVPAGAVHCSFHANKHRQRHVRIEAERIARGAPARKR